MWVEVLCAPAVPASNSTTSSAGTTVRDARIAARRYPPRVPSVNREVWLGDERRIAQTEGLGPAGRTAASRRRSRHRPGGVLVVLRGSRPARGGPSERDELSTPQGHEEATSRALAAVAGARLLGCWGGGGQPHGPKATRF